jgi:hypothetical protein
MTHYQTEPRMRGDAHAVSVQDGLEYPGETYIDCSCGASFSDAGIEALTAFLREHEAIPPAPYSREPDAIDRQLAEQARADRDEMDRDQAAIRAMEAARARELLRVIAAEAAQDVVYREDIAELTGLVTKLLGT